MRVLMCASMYVFSVHHVIIFIYTRISIYTYHIYNNAVCVHTYIYIHIRMVACVFSEFRRSVRLSPVRAPTNPVPPAGRLQPLFSEIRPKPTEQPGKTVLFLVSNVPNELLYGSVLF